MKIVVFYDQPSKGNLTIRAIDSDKACYHEVVLKPGWEKKYTLDQAIHEFKKRLHQRGLL
jgi:hypothetical protein